jgi:hypothetical protein
MGLFSKKEKKSESGIPVLPTLPRLPELPELPEREDYHERNIHQLPSLPSSSIGAKFSRDTIKDAVSGEMGNENKMYEEDFSDDDMRMMREPLRRPTTEELEDEIEEEFRERPRRPSARYREETEPVFIRIDKFEEGLKLFETVKRQISDIEKILADTKRMKEKEEIELNAWEAELKKMKEEIEKIGNNIFSKV